jgi:hypothetical protein
VKHLATSKSHGIVSHQDWYQERTLGRPRIHTVRPKRNLPCHPSSIFQHTVLVG